MTNKSKQAEIDDKLSEICFLSILINNHTDYCSFMDLSGHVNSISFSIRESKTNYQRELIREEFYFDHDGPSKINQKLDKVIALFKEILEKNKIDYGKLKVSRAAHTYQLFRA